ncbi:MAG: cardiolipin synthase [Lachnospira sp.]
MNNMRTEKKTSIKNSAGRLVFIVLLVLVQTIWLEILLFKLNTYSTVITFVLEIIAVFIALKIYCTHVNAAQKMPWLIVITAFPIVGVFIYLLFGRSVVTKGMRRRFNSIEKEVLSLNNQDAAIMDELEEKDLGIANQFRYVSNCVSYPVYKNTDIVYYSDADKGFEAQLEELKKAEKFIFMEYHAIEDAESFARLKEILINKAKEGVEVRIFYDDIGSIFFLNQDFIKYMREQGIQCRVFNPLKVVVNMFMNNRDHRKITVIDGKVGFTGGYNLADEYFNITHPYGYWKDTGIKVVGDAVRSLTASFLTMWNAIEKTDTDYEKYLNEHDDKFVSSDKDTFVQPYSDNPLGKERAGENVYLNIIKNAKRYLYITTPYLIITDEMDRELSLAAKRGVDVRIVTPGIPDKKMVYKMTRSYYAPLVSDGVRIYEYTPGFMHAKQWVCDDEIAVVGTINMDHRSLYLHFENACLVYGKGLAADVKKDMLDNFEISTEVTDKYKSDNARKMSIGECMLRLIAPLL